MLFIQLSANSIHLDLGLRLGSIYDTYERVAHGADKQAWFLHWRDPIIGALGYRWIFSNKMFFDWDFIERKAGFTFLSFKIGKVISNNKYTVYGIITPLTLLGHFEEGFMGMTIEDGRIKLAGSYSTLGFALGVGMSYQIKNNVSFFAEIRASLRYPNTVTKMVAYLKEKKVTWDSQDASYGGGHVLAGVSIHNL